MGSPGSTSSEFSSPGGGVAGMGSPGGATTTTGIQFIFHFIKYYLKGDYAMNA